MPCSFANSRRKLRSQILEEVNRTGEIIQGQRSILPGLHFCPDWDDLAIWEGCPEWACCSCDNKSGEGG